MSNVRLPKFSDNGITTIPLSKGLVSIIDSSDDRLILPHKWHASKSGNAFYARASLRGPLEGIQMHRYIIDAPKGLQVDHINGDTLDNRRCNLRLVTAAENMKHWAARHFNSKSSQFTGVIRSGNGWIAQIYWQGETHYLGSYRNELEAAKAYDDASEKWRGSRVNFPLTEGECV